MTLEEFQEWIMQLPLQTLTDELKDDIIINARNLAKESADETRLKINREVLEFIKIQNKKK